MDKLALNFTPFYIMANVRNLLSGPHNKRMQNWVLAMEIFAVGSTSSIRICAEAEIDPYAYQITKLPPATTKAKQ